jgi:hypothetical protein
MSSVAYSVEAERALARLEQLAREEQAAVSASDLDALCRVSALLHDAVTRLMSGPLDGISRLTERVDTIQAAHGSAESFLSARMAENREMLRHLAGARRTIRGYGNAPTPSASRISGEG